MACIKVGVREDNQNGPFYPEPLQNSCIFRARSSAHVNQYRFTEVKGASLKSVLMTDVWADCCFQLCLKGKIPWGVFVNEAE